MSENQRFPNVFKEFRNRALRVKMIKVLLMSYFNNRKSREVLDGLRYTSVIQ